MAFALFALVALPIVLIPDRWSPFDAQDRINLVFGIIAYAAGWISCMAAFYFPQNDD